MQLTYQGNTQQPSLSDLLSLTDNSDPLNITRGNPNLKPSFNQNIRLEARNTKIGQSGDLNWSNTINNITRAVTYNAVTGGIQLRSDAAYSFRNGTNIRKGADDQVVWNVRLAWRFLKQKKAELSFYWSDILSQKKNFTRSVSSAGLSERHTQQIGSYFIVTFKYRFNRQL